MSAAINMTLENIFKSVLASATAKKTDYLPSSQLPKHLREKSGGSSDYYNYDIRIRKNGRPVTGERAPANSLALQSRFSNVSPLLFSAFLFFLNILQNCIREQNQNRGTVMMFGPTAPTAPTAPAARQGKGLDPVRRSKFPENLLRVKRGVPTHFPEKNFSEEKRDSRKKLRHLTGITESEKSVTHGERRLKFMQDLEGVKNWTSHLSRVSEQDLKIQKLKTSNFPFYWKNSRLASEKTTPFPSPGPLFPKPASVTHRPVSNNTKTSLDMRNINKRDKTPTADSDETSGVRPTSSASKMWHYRKSPFPNAVDIGKRGNFGEKHRNNSEFRGSGGRRRFAENPTAILPFLPASVGVGVGDPSVSTTVADASGTRRFDTASTPKSLDYGDYDKLRENGSLPPAAAVGLDLNTFQTFPVYHRYNHPPNAIVDPYVENQTADADEDPNAAQGSEKTEAFDASRIREDTSKDAIDPPLFYPTKLSPSSYYTHSHYEKIRHRYPSRDNLHHAAFRQPTESRFKYTPYRKVGSYEAPHFHDEYFGPVVLAKYEQDEDSGFDLANFFWTTLASFAKPLTKLVPSFAKESDEEARCYDLLVCEAQRASKLIGPTAEALAATVGTLLTWAATEDTRQVVVDAINAGRVNTCQQQIRDCEDRSGGKSALTMIAQVMELKLR